MAVLLKEVWRNADIGKMFLPEVDRIRIKMIVSEGMPKWNKTALSLLKVGASTPEK